MIPVPSQTASGAVRVWLATGHTDMRNYAARTIMPSARRDVVARRGFLVGLTQHNSACVLPRSTWPEACLVRGSDRASAWAVP